MSTKHPELERGSKIRLFETNENEAIDSPSPRNIEAKMPHRKIYNPMMELTTVRARGRLPTVYQQQSAYENTEGAAAERTDAKGAKVEGIGAKTTSEGNTCHAVKARQIYGLKRSAEGAGGRAICQSRLYCYAATGTHVTGRLCIRISTVVLPRG